MKEIKAAIQPFRFESVCEALQAIEGLPGLTVSQVAGWGKTLGRDQGDVVEAGHTFAGKIFIFAVDDVLKIRTGDRGSAAI